MSQNEIEEAEDVYPFEDDEDEFLSDEYQEENQ